MVPGMNVGLAAEVIQQFGSYERFLSARHPNLLMQAQAEADRAVMSNINVHFCHDESYPRLLRECPDAPVVLYSCGNGNLNPTRSVAIVGTRHATSHGIAFTRELVKTLADKVGPVTIVSGLAYGIDITAHRTALECGLPTVSVVAHGLRMIYPADHRQDAQRIIRSGGAIVTEYQADARPYRNSFLARNRIIAGMANVTVVIESDLRGGSMSTARRAFEYNREVFAMPGYPSAIYSRGCNDLIARQQAHILSDPAQIMEIMRWDAKPAKPAARQMSLFIELTPEQQRIIDHLRQQPDATVNEMSSALRIPYAQLSSTLFDLEMQDILATRPGGRYAIIAAV